MPNSDQALPQNLSGFLTTGQAARELRISAARIRQLYHAGTLRIAVQTPYGPLFDPTDIEAEKDRRGKVVAS